MDIYMKIIITCIITGLTGVLLNKGGAGLGAEFPKARDQVQFTGLVSVVLSVIAFIATFLIMVWNFKG